MNENMTGLRGMLEQMTTAQLDEMLRCELENKPSRPSHIYVPTLPRSPRGSRLPPACRPRPAPAVPPRRSIVPACGPAPGPHKTKGSCELSTQIRSALWTVPSVSGSQPSYIWCRDNVHAASKTALAAAYLLVRSPWTHPLCLYANYAISCRVCLLFYVGSCRQDIVFLKKALWRKFPVPVRSGRYCCCIEICRFISVALPLSQMLSYQRDRERKRDTFAIDTDRGTV